MNGPISQERGLFAHITYGRGSPFSSSSSSSSSSNTPKTRLLRVFTQQVDQLAIIKIFDKGGTFQSWGILALLLMSNE